MRNGFTLIEILVAISIFSIMLLLVVGIFSRFIAVQRRDVGEFRLQEDLRLALEFFNREARIGYGNTYSIDQNSFIFRNQNGRCVVYRVANEALQRAEQEITAGTCLLVSSNEQFQSLTSSSTRVNKVLWQVVPAIVSADGLRLESQGIVSLSVQAESKAKQGSSIAGQDTVTSRQFIPYRPL